MVFGFLTLSIIVVAASFILELFHVKFLKFCHGIDLLFFAPWLFAFKFGFFNAMLLGFTIMAIHIVFNLHMAHFVLFALPALVIAIILGEMMGIAGFYISLALFMIASAVTTTMFGGFGPRFVIFLVVGTLFNIGLFSVYQNVL